MTRRKARQSRSQQGLGDNIVEVLRLIHLAESVCFSNFDWKTFFKMSEKTAAVGADEDINKFEEFCKLVVCQFSKTKSLHEQLEEASQHILHYLKSDDNSVVVGTTYGVIRKFVQAIDDAGYFSRCNEKELDYVVIAPSKNNEHEQSTDADVNNDYDNDDVDDDLVSENNVTTKNSDDVLMSTVEFSEICLKTDTDLSEIIDAATPNDDPDLSEVIDAAMPNDSDTRWETLFMLQQFAAAKNVNDGIDRTLLKSYAKKCPHCGRVFASNASLAIHLPTHAEIRPYACPLCPKRFNQLANAKRHFERKHIDDKPYVCGWCEKKFATDSLLRVHLRQHGFFDKKSNGNNDDATGREKFSCETCGRVLSSHRRLHRHRLTHTRGQQCYVCSTCGRIYTNACHFARHRSSHMNNPVSCSTCGRSFARLELLKAHQRVHNTLRPYVCQKCGRAFKRPVDLRLHDRTHTGLRPYVCAICGASFAQSHSLRYHSRCHTNERPHPCQHCSRQFRTPDKLRVHLRTHTGERPYECQLCGMKFGDKSAMRRHIRRHNSRGVVAAVAADVGPVTSNVPTVGDVISRSSSPVISQSVQ